MKSLRATLKLSNNRLVRLREELGHRTAAAFCRQSGISYMGYVKLENLHSPPYLPNGQPTRIAQQVADFHGVGISWLFPQVLGDLTQLPTLAREVEPQEVLDTLTKQQLLHGALRALEPRMRLIVERHVAGVDLQALGEQLNLSRERVRQLYYRGLRKLQDDPALRRLAAEEHAL